jgi:pSer/pThr/pTyr-binding forkhead associated (FHA) protein
VALRLQVTDTQDPKGHCFTYEFDRDRSQILLGRRGGVDVLLPRAKVSLVHARIERQGERYLLVDDSSTNGTQVNGERVAAGESKLLAHGDRIAIGDFTVAVELVQPGAAGAPTEDTLTTGHRMVREVLDRVGTGDSLPSLTVANGPSAGRRLLLGEGRTYILGRGQNSDLCLDDVDMWSEHAALVRDREGVTVRDLGSANGLTVDGKRVAGARALRDGETLVLGSTSLVFADPVEAYLRKLEEVVLPESAREPVRGRRVEVLLAIAGASAAVLAAAGLVYLLWS